jgi:hypothetical protein
MNTESWNALIKRGGITAIVTALFCVVMTPSWETISSVIFPASLISTGLVTVLVVIIALGLVVVFYRPNPELVPLRSAAYYLMQPGLEEVLFRFNIIMVLKESRVEAFWLILVIALLQAYLFAVMHNVKAFPKVLISSFVYFIAAYYYGMIPAVVAHTVGNLVVRAKMLRDSGD